MEAIKDTVKNVIQGLMDKRGGKDIPAPEAALKKTLTKRELKHIKLNNFKKGILSINVDSSSWLYSFSLKKEELLAKLRKDCGEIKDIRFFVGVTR